VVLSSLDLQFSSSVVEWSEVVELHVEEAREVADAAMETPAQ
jgi:hypothetical protein